MNLGRRLSALTDLVTKTQVMADVGCDHGYVSISLIERGICSEVIAMDINKGPLHKAEENILLYGYGEQIKTRLSDGLNALSEGEANGIICAGMGGRLLLKILEDGMPKIRQMDQLILQPQSEIAYVRHTLYESGFSFLKEDMVLEDGKYYPMFSVQYRGQGKQTLSVEQSLAETYGEGLLASKNEVLHQYLRTEEIKLKKLLLHILPNQESAAWQTRKRREELSLALQLNLKAQELYQ